MRPSLTRQHSSALHYEHLFCLCCLGFRLEKSLPLLSVELEHLSATPVLKGIIHVNIMLLAFHPFPRGTVSKFILTF